MRRARPRSRRRCCIGPASWCRNATAAASPALAPRALSRARVANCNAQRALGLPEGRVLRGPSELPAEAAVFLLYSEFQASWHPRVHMPGVGVAMSPPTYGSGMDFSANLDDNDAALGIFPGLQPLTPQACQMDYVTFKTDATCLRLFETLSA